VIAGLIGINNVKISNSKWFGSERNQWFHVTTIPAPFAVILVIFFCIPYARGEHGHISGDDRAPLQPSHGENGSGSVGVKLSPALLLRCWQALADVIRGETMNFRWRSVGTEIEIKWCRSPSLAHRCSGSHRRAQDHQARRTHAVALR